MTEIENESINEEINKRSSLLISALNKVIEEFYQSDKNVDIHLLAQVVFGALAALSSAHINRCSCGLHRTEYYTTFISLLINGCMQYTIEERNKNGEKNEQ